MRILRIALLWLWSIGLIFAQAAEAPPSSSPEHRPRVALALSGGGSLGLAHIGVLQYFEEHHIPVDAIAGTSIGGLVGGMYATGHTPAQIQQAFAEAVWDDYLRVQPRYQDLPIVARRDRVRFPGEYTLRLGRGLSLPAGLSTAEPLDLYLSRLLLDYSTVDDFAQLPTPFRCVATQLETGEPFVLSHGNLARALRATMAVPGIFTPVEWQGKILVDGGLVDNLPTDVARAMGADVVVAVHFSTPVPPAKQLQSLSNVLTQAVSVAVSVTERENLRNADLVLAPSLVGIGGTDYSHARELIERGYQAAAQKQRFLATLALSDKEWAEYVRQRQSRMKPVPPAPTQWKARSSDPALERFAQKELDATGGPRTTAALEEQLSLMTTSAALPSAFYRLSETTPKTVVAEVDPRQGSQIFVRPALDVAAANGEPTRGTLHGFIALLPQDAYRARYRMQFSAGYSPGLAGSYEHPFAASRWFWSPSFNLQRLNSATYVGSQNQTHWQDSYSGAFAVGYEPGRYLRLSGGVESGYEQLSAVAFPGAAAIRNGGYVAPQLEALWNSLDDPALPTRGTLLTATMGARYRHWNGATVPLGRACLEKNLAMLKGTWTASLSAATSFGSSPTYFDLFPLGGTAGLRAFRYEQFHASSYALGGLSYRKPIAKILGQRPQLAAWYEAAGIKEPLASRQSEQSGSVGALFTSPLGVVTVGIGHTSDGQTRGWIAVGRP